MESGFPQMENGLEKLIREHGKEKLDKAIENLPPRARRAVRLYYFQERKYKEVAVIMKIKINTVKSQLSQALVLLKERLSKIERS